MPVLLECTSHTPVMGRNDPTPDVVEAVEAALDRSRNEIDEFAPELILMFAPDHFMGFFHNVLPSFCIGAAATSLGDYDTKSGSLPVPNELAIECATAVQAAGIDIAVSHDMKVDHGFAQPLEMLTGAIDRYPVLPVYINTLGRPRPTMSRTRQMGRAIGDFFASHHRDKRILIVGSGGISHDPPVPSLETAPSEIRARLIAGGARTPEAQSANEARVVNAAREFALADPVLGGGALLPLDPRWDIKILNALMADDFDVLDAMSDDEISRYGGRGGHEIRTWVAAYSCLRAYGAYGSDLLYYRAIPEWIAGFAVTNGRPCVE